MAYRSEREHKSTCVDSTPRLIVNDHNEEMFQLGYQLDHIRMRLEQEEISSEATSIIRAQDQVVPSPVLPASLENNFLPEIQPLHPRLKTFQRTNSTSSQATSRHQKKRGRAPSNPPSPTSPASSPRKNKKDKSNNVVDSASKSPQLPNMNADVSSDGTPKSQNEPGNERSFGSPYLTSDTSSGSPISLPSSGTGKKKTINYIRIPTKSTKPLDRHGLGQAQAVSRENRRNKILSIDNWRRNDAPSMRSPVFDQSAMEFVPPKDEDVRAAMVSTADNVSEKMRRILAVVLQQQAAANLGTITPFRPSYPALQRMNLLPGLDEHRSTVSSSVFGVSKNYLGDLSVPENHSANIPEDQNCSLWLTGLPADITYTALLHSIRGVGKVYATWINKASVQHRTAAAKVVLFDRKAAETLFKLIEGKSLLVLGRPIQAHWNRIKVARYYRPEQSRVIKITGPAQLMDFGFFQKYFETLFTFQLDKRLEIPYSIDGMVSHEWHFGSLRCQAQHAKDIVERELRPTFSVQWACDPCQSP